MRASRPPSSHSFSSFVPTEFTYVRDPSLRAPKHTAPLSIKEIIGVPWSELEKRFGKKTEQQRKAFLDVGQFRIDLDKKLGSGSFGEVRLAWDSAREVQVVSSNDAFRARGQGRELILRS